jgi:hypothetical protein
LPPTTNAGLFLTLGIIFAIFGILWGGFLIIAIPFVVYSAYLYQKEMGRSPKPSEPISTHQDKPSTKEIVREKEVIVKVRCKYCGNTYNETLDKCPNCGGHA